MLIRNKEKAEIPENIAAILFSEPIADCVCGRVRLPDGQWIGHEHRDYRSKKRMVGSFAYCPNCIAQRMGKM